jgi:site-specific DNA-methyltransferase (adenine-specific)
MLETNKIYQGDCLELMKDLSDESIDLILTDTPYGINFKSNMDINNRFDYIANDCNLNFLKPFIKQAYRVLKNNSCIFLFCRFDNYPYFYNTIIENGFKVKNCLVWEKNKALGGLGDMESSFLNNYEFVLFAMKGRKILFKDRIGRQFGLIKDDTISNPLQLLYPTQKPLKILRKLISLTTNEQDIVLDCFCGSGSTCLASKQTNRKYIGIDINPKAVEICNKRLLQEILELKSSLEGKGEGK